MGFLGFSSLSPASMASKPPPSALGTDPQIVLRGEAQGAGMDRGGGQIRPGDLLKPRRISSDFMVDVW